MPKKDKATVLVIVLFAVAIAQGALAQKFGFSGTWSYWLFNLPLGVFPATFGRNAALCQEINGYFWGAAVAYYVYRKLPKGI